jgi:hypothetical protein
MFQSDNHDHEAKVLHTSPYGFLVYCPGCRRFQLAYGTFRLSQDEEELNSFARLINRYAHRYLQRAERKKRDIFIDSPFPGFGLFFSVEDLDRLNNILQRSLLLIEASDRVRLQ